MGRQFSRKTLDDGHSLWNGHGQEECSKERAEKGPVKGGVCLDRGRPTDTLRDTPVFRGRPPQTPPTPSRHLFDTFSTPFRHLFDTFSTLFRHLSPCPDPRRPADTPGFWGWGGQGPVHTWVCCPFFSRGWGGQGGAGGREYGGGVWGGLAATRANPWDRFPGAGRGVLGWGRQGRVFPKHALFVGEILELTRGVVGKGPRTNRCNFGRSHPETQCDFESELRSL